MQIIRTILWVIVTAMLVAFIAMNWTKVPVNIWPLDDGNYLHFEWPIGVVALLFFALGALPMWVIHRAGRWRLKRRIHSLEHTVQATASAQAPYEPSAYEPGPGSGPAIAHEPPMTPTIAADPDYRPGTVDPDATRPL
jgi:putative membrane protein